MSGMEILMEYIVEEGLLRSLRRAKGLKQGELAELTDISQPKISRIENGQLELIDLSYKELRELADVLEVSIDDLIGVIKND